MNGKRMIEVRKAMDMPFFIPHQQIYSFRYSFFDKKTQTQTYMFICQNPDCWRFKDYDKLKDEWMVKEWRVFKCNTPQNAIMNPIVEPKVETIINNYEERKRSIVQAVQTEPKESETRRSDESCRYAESGGQGVSCIA